MIYKNGDYSLQVNLVCDDSKDTPVVSALKNLGGKAYSATFTGKDACPALDFSAIWDFFNENIWLWAIIMIVAGLFICLLGRQLFKVTIFLAATFITIAAILLLFYSTFLKSNTEDWVAWTVLAISLVLGLIVGFLATKVLRLGAAVLAGWGGFMIGVLINVAL